MTARAFVDSNILLYAVSGDPADVAKKQTALALLKRGDLGLSTQVLSEFYVVSTGAKLPSPLSHDEAEAFINIWKRFAIQAVTVEVFERALAIRKDLPISFWDALILAAAVQLGCHTLYSEDFNHGQQFGDLKALNPFRVGTSLSV